MFQFVIVQRRKSLLDQPRTFVSGYVKDDCSAAETQSTGQYETGPPGGGYTVARVAAILHSVVQEASRLLAVLANYGDEEIDQAVVKNGAVIKNGGD